MIFAMKRLKTIGWIFLVLIVLIGLYPLSLSVATLRSDLARTESAIMTTKSEIRYLETEYATRASLEQLQMWNDLGYGYTAPQSDQYLEGERALANLGDADGAPHTPVRVAAMTVDGADIAPAGTIGGTLSDLQSIEKTTAKSALAAANTPNSPALSGSGSRSAASKAAVSGGASTNQASANQTRTNQASANQARTNQASANQAAANRAILPAPMRRPALDQRAMDSLALEATVEQLREKHR